MVDFSTPQQEDRYSSDSGDPVPGRFTEPTGSRFAAVINAIVSAVFVIAFPVFLVGLTLRLLGDRVSQSMAQQIILVVLGLGVVAWFGVMAKGIQLSRYLPGADFSGMREDD